MAVADSNFQVFILSPENFAQEVPRPGWDRLSDRSADTSATSLFRGHLLKADKFQETTQLNTLPVWFFFVIFFNLLLIAYIKISSPRRISEVLNGFLRLRYIAQIKRDHASIMPKGGLELNINYLVGFSLLLYLFYAYITHTPFYELSFTPLLYIMAGFGGLYLLKLSAYYFIGKVLLISEQATNYNINLSLFKEALGLALVPLNLIFILHPPAENPGLVFVGGIFLLVYYIIRFVRSFIILSTKTKFSKFYLFLYLCTLEVIPFVLITVYINRYVQL